MSSVASEPAVWFPAIRSGSGADVFTERLCVGLNQRGIHAEITWLPLRTEYAPWSIPKMIPPPWANIVHVNTWFPFKLLPAGLPIVATVHHTVHLPNLGYEKGLLRSAYHQFWIAPNERRILARADCVIAVSSFVVRATRQTLLDRAIRVIGNGVDADRFSPSDKPPSFSQCFACFISEHGASPKE
jgi:glycosyltransferase involved in cell wall biosynthesis